MFAYEHVAHIGSLVPSGLTGHLVKYVFAVDYKIVKRHTLYPALTVISDYQRHTGPITIIKDIFE